MCEAVLRGARDGQIGAGTIKAIAAYLDIDYSTVYDWMGKHGDFAEAITRARGITDEDVESALRRRATGYEVTLVEQRVDKEGNVHDLKKDVHLPADTAAATFWLKNRDPKRWADKTQVEVTSDFAEQVEAFLATQRKDA
jgi:ClpP class serine protease